VEDDVVLMPGVRRVMNGESWRGPKITTTLSHCQNEWALPQWTLFATRIQLLYLFSANRTEMRNFVSVPCEDAKRSAYYHRRKHFF